MSIQQNPMSHRLYEEATGRQTGDTGRGWVSASHSTMVPPQPGPARTSVTSASLSLTRSQEPTGTEEVQVSRQRKS